MRPARAALGLLLGAAGCAAAPAGPAVEGRGLVDPGPPPPAGARLFEAPELRPGDRFSFRRGGIVDLAFTVVAAGPDGYTFEEQATGLRSEFTRALWARGQSLPGEAAADRAIEPYDPQLTWPMWVGKRWVAHFVRDGGGARLPVAARYDCDAVETLQTEAGAFECLRVWRRTRPAVEGAFFERVDLSWYAPALGFFVRKVEDGMLTELVGYQRATGEGGPDPIPTGPAR